MRLGYATECHPVLTGRLCFNEAEAHAPRIQRQNEVTGLMPDIASMRPRRMRLGYHQACSRIGIGTGRFNEAEAHAPRIRMRPWWRTRSVSRLQ